MSQRLCASTCRNSGLQIGSTSMASKPVSDSYVLRRIKTLWSYGRFTFFKLPLLRHGCSEDILGDYIARTFWALLCHCLKNQAKSGTLRRRPYIRVPLHPANLEFDQGTLIASWEPGWGILVLRCFVAGPRKISHNVLPTRPSQGCFVESRSSMPRSARLIWHNDASRDAKQSTIFHQSLCSF
ncbi:hypothetical protein M011DRAFT_237142 [Sporormia fimetaria CBS 119925]|uniref:Uncharacterized protein n=1 Tax=Sporormia fimetaria CBS 119925 TaxID=1340428 RepID=A0A6A6VI79_9PLEO|nr:hypothetical protein M011DRAFT_237142 [Sporormia fimetaria CBS 119925]